MRKLGRIVAGVFSVCGLFAGLAAFFASPVSAENGLVSVSLLTPEGGTYTVAWKAKGECNPALDGSVTKTISDGASGADLNLGYFTIDEDCLYEFTGTYLSAAGAFDVAGEPVPAGVRCAASVDVRRSDGGITTVPSATVSVDTEDCVATSDLVVRVTGPADDGVVDNSHHRSAVKAHSWLITVTPNGKGSDGKAETVAAECVEVKGEATDMEHDIPEIKFKLVARGLNAADGSARSCQYNVGVTLLDGYVEAVKGVIPVKGFTPLPNGESLIDFTLKVARRKVYMVQNVSGTGGEVGSNFARYEARVTCSYRGKQLPLPQIIESISYAEAQERRLEPLTEGSFSVLPHYSLPYSPPCCAISSPRASSATPGIYIPRFVTFVPLKEGRFDVTSAVTDSVSTAGGRHVLVANAVDADGRPCAYRVWVDDISPRFLGEDVPASGSEEADLPNCTVKEDSLTIDLPTAEPQSILEFFFICPGPEGDTPTG